MNLFHWFDSWKTHREMARKGMVNVSSRKVNSRRSKWNLLWHYSRFPAYVMLFFVFLATIFSVMLPWNLLPVQSVENVKSAPNNIYAQFSFEYPDQEQTDIELKRALSRLPVYLKIEKGTIKKIDSEYSELVSEVHKKAASKSGSFGYAASSSPIGQKIRKMPEDQFKFLVKVFADKKITESIRQKLRQSINSGLINISLRRFADSHLREICYFDEEERRCYDEEKPLLISTAAEAATKIAEDISGHFYAAERNQIVLVLADCLDNLLSQAVMVKDEEKQKQMSLHIRKTQEKIMIGVKKGTLLLRKNAPITKKDEICINSYRSKLLSLRNFGSYNYQDILKSVAISILLVSFGVFFVIRIHPDLLKETRSLCLIQLIILLGIGQNILCWKLFVFLDGIFSFPPILLFMSLPLAFVPVIVSVLFGLRAALFAGLYISLTVAVAVENSFDILLTGILVGTFSSFIVIKAMNFRSYFMRSLSSTYILTLLLGACVLWKDGLFPLKQSLIWFFINPLIMVGILAVSVQVMLTVIDFFFDVTTNMSLLTYSDYNHKLLQKLQIQAPGTYHHSLLVSILAESAAKKIGANSIKARVCALFHDVGKIEHPEYFTENERGENKHADLPPKISARVIINHVKDGMSLAYKYKLKRPMREAISQHHGTDLVQYFYHQAMNSGEPVDMQSFRYPGPRPQSKEVAIVSLADACEAASRSLSGGSMDKIEALVTEIIIKRLRSQQLDDAELTFKELMQIRDSFVSTLVSMLHSRISYPKEKKDNDEIDLFMAETGKKTS